VKRIKLTKAWSNDGTEYEVGTVLEVDVDTAKSLVADGYGTSDDVVKVVKAVDAGDNATKTTDNTETEHVTIKRADYDELVKKLATRSDDNDDPVNRPVIGKSHERVLDDDTRGYGKYEHGGYGKFLQEVRRSCDPARSAKDPERLSACKFENVMKAVGSDEYASIEDAIGGFLIPPAYSPEILQKGVEDHWVQRFGARMIPVPSTMMTINAITDEDRQTNLYGGIQVYWLKERGQMTGVKGEFQRIELKPQALTALAFATDAELNYAPTLQAIIGSQFQDALIYKELTAYVGGTGAGEPLGILNAACTYSQAKETGQAAATIVTSNILKMRSRMRPQEYSKGMWYASLSCMEQLNLLTIDVGTGGAPVALVNIGNDGIERILGRPLVYTEFAEAIGTVGDLVLASWPTYLIGEGTYSNVASSIHVRFDFNETAFRFVKQCDGQPWWRTTLTLKNAWEVAPFVTLAARA
jgi:HK97 family phage major capsid protein